MQAVVGREVARVLLPDLVTMALTTAVSDGAEGSSVIQTELQAVAEPRTTSGNELRCTSRGTLERRILEIIAERVHAGSSHAELTPL